MRILRNCLLILYLLLVGNTYAQDTLRVKVMTYNLRFGELAELKDLAAHIKSFNPDFVALQEVDSKTNRDRTPHQRGKDFISELAYYTGMFGLYGKTIEYTGGYYGIGILSKYPYIKIQKTLLPQLGKDYEQRVLLEGLFEMNGDTIVFASTHLDAKLTKTRELQAEFINNHFRKVDYPTILGGDFNSDVSSKVIKELKQEWFCDADMTPTVPAWKPYRKIDFLFAKPQKGWKVIRTQTIQSVLSDHLPIITELEYIRP